MEQILSASVMLKIYKKALDEVAKLDLKKLKISMEFDFALEGSADFRILILEKDNSNEFFSFYDFHSLSKNASELQRVLDLIRLDDLDAIRERMPGRRHAKHLKEADRNECKTA